MCIPEKRGVQALVIVCGIVRVCYGANAGWAKSSRDWRLQAHRGRCDIKHRTSSLHVHLVADARYVHEVKSLVLLTSALAADDVALLSFITAVVSRRA